ncbi:hypothetical protein ABTQ33_07020 [Paucilactobacillus suebicus]|uniref:Uncharacterized protein n=1 Tax=Paucilactobacillus suebicus DSM 5007 = KCTC 3549 TaxID=1423807 RepID=A0A0R1VTN1_9LACO|nr:hypothetical protein [Paucilactobacillus suebicus]KRM08773.1 hypothetical protein FD16_GL002225 [Paucilactobacillus suebicus DSM 5007 = KCTC 3549]
MKKRFTRLFVVLLALVCGAYFGSSTASAHKVTPKYVAKLVNKDLKEPDETGTTKFKWIKKDQAFEAVLDPNCDMYQQMDSGQVSVWESYTKAVKYESKTLKKSGYSKYSNFAVINPEDHSKIFLQIAKGKTLYDVKDDLQ